MRKYIFDKDTHIAIYQKEYIAIYEKALVSSKYADTHNIDQIVGHNYLLKMQNLRPLTTNAKIEIRGEKKTEKKLLKDMKK